MLPDSPEIESDPLEELSAALGEAWPAIFAARAAAREEETKLHRLIAGVKPPANTSVVAFGSLAREEWTSGSDLDWTLLVDGPSDMRHFDVTKSVEQVFEKEGYREPGPTGTFGVMSSSHELVHYIGGGEDTNRNITRRILLLLESTSLSDPVTHDRVIRAILERYIIGDPPATSPARFRVPLFLLNDVVRFWRTMTVDYATKKWQRSNAGWALRNIKLRMSRKLLFAKGMLTCFLCHEDFAGKPKTGDPELVELELLEICLGLSRRTAVDLLADSLARFAEREVAKKTLGAYDRFLEGLNDAAKRERLKTIGFEERADPVYLEQRDNTIQFREGLESLFFESNNSLTRFTKRYGVF